MKPRKSERPRDKVKRSVSIGVRFSEYMQFGFHEPSIIHHKHPYPDKLIIRADLKLVCLLSTEREHIENIRSLAYIPEFIR